MVAGGGIDAWAPMYFDLNLPVPSSSKVTPAQIAVVDAKVDALSQLGYTTIALNHVVQSKFDPKVHSSKRLDEILEKLKPRDNLVLLKRLTIVLDEGSEKGLGLTTQHQAHFTGYDILALAPTTMATFSLACLTHTVPSPLTTHIISLPTDLPRQLKLKHTLVKTVIRNGAMFEICYSGALSVDEGMRRNWWGCAREGVRACSKGVVVSWGGEDAGSLRAPRDVANLVVLLGLVQGQALNAVSKNARTAVIHSQTRKTYRAILSEPRIVYPDPSTSQLNISNTVDSGVVPHSSALSVSSATSQPIQTLHNTDVSSATLPPATQALPEQESSSSGQFAAQPSQATTLSTTAEKPGPGPSLPDGSPAKSLKRTRPPSPDGEARAERKLLHLDNSRRRSRRKRRSRAVVETRILRESPHHNSKPADLAAV